MATAMNEYGQHEFVADRPTARLRIASTPYAPGTSAMSTVELEGHAVLLTTDEMLELYTQLAKSLGYTTPEEAWAVYTRSAS